MDQILLPLILVTPFVAALLIPLAASYSRSAAAWSAGGAMLLGLAFAAPLAPSVLSGTPIGFSMPWLPSWGLNFALQLDGLALLFVILILGIGALIVLYAAYYMPAYDRLGRFYSLLLAFAGSMVGIALSDNLILMLVFWEITSLTSFLLIAYKYEESTARVAARMSLAVTGAGGLALLAGILLLGHIGGSYEVSTLIERADQIRSNQLYPAALVLILLGAFTKSAQFPFHFWLPNAMAAPTPVSAYLHSATMVKAGVFLLGRLYPVLAGTDLWVLIVSITGGITMVYGAYLAMLKDDFKGLLAYSTVSHLGLITLLFGLGTKLAAVAAVFHIINHAIFKASLFMSAGIIDHETGTRDMRRLHGLFKFMPWTATLGIVAAASMAGVPLLNGFLSKEMFFAETIGHPIFQNYGAYVLPIFATVASTLAVAYSTRFVHEVFFSGPPVDLPRQPHEPPRWMRFPVELLVALVLLVGVLPQLTVGAILYAAAQSVLPGGVPEFHLAVWHGFNLPLVMSIVALAGGLLYYTRRHQLFRLHARYLPQVSSPRAFERFYFGASDVAGRFLRAIDGPSLQAYLALFFGFSILWTLWAWLTGPQATLFGPVPGMGIEPLAVGAFAALAIGAVGAVICHRERVTALIFTSVVGLIVVLAFVRFAAPDLALTQLSVEVVTIVMLLLALRYLPSTVTAESSALRRWRDGGIAIAAGGGISALCYAMLTRPFETISGYHIANSVPGGGGTNVVNVILVDFRGFDTLGEITVVALAAIGLYALLDGLRATPHAHSATREADRHPIMLAMLMRPLLPLALAVAVYILLRGHNLPGGGFIAGLVAAVAMMLQYMANGFDYAQARFRANYLRVIGLGLLTAAGTGIASWFFGYPFLTSTHAYVYPPVIDKFEVASAMVFDLGVFLVVFASVLLILSELGKLSRRERSDEPAEGGTWS
jgi:multicomponent K+:H+ antiporter subunit A